MVLPSRISYWVKVKSRIFTSAFIIHHFCLHPSAFTSQESRGATATLSGLRMQVARRGVV